MECPKCSSSLFDVLLYHQETETWDGSSLTADQLYHPLDPEVAVAQASCSQCGEIVPTRENKYYVSQLYPDPGLVFQGEVRARDVFILAHHIVQTLMKELAQPGLCLACGMPRTASEDSYRCPECSRMGPASIITEGRSLLWKPVNWKANSQLDLARVDWDRAQGLVIEEIERHFHDHS